MTWFKVDDGVLTHQKFARLFESDLGSDAVALWTLAGAYCARELTNGRISKGQVKRLGPNPASAVELVRVGLWSELESGEYAFHDWFDYQPSAEVVQSRRESGAKRKAEHRKRLGNASREAEKPASPNASQLPRPMPRTDIGDVTPVPRAESRGCLTGDGISSSEISSLNSEVSSSSEPLFSDARARESAGGLEGDRPDRGSCQVSEFRTAKSVGYDWLMGVTGCAPNPHGWERAYSELGLKPANERSLVAAHLMQTAYIRDERRKAKPDHVLRYWDDFVAGPRNFDRLKPPTPGRGAAPVSSAEEFAEDRRKIAAGESLW